MSKNNLKSDKILDQRGRLCPMPIITANNEIASLSKGQILEVICDDPGSQSDFEAWTKSRGHNIVSSSNTSNTFRFLIKKGE